MLSAIHAWQAEASPTAVIIISIAFMLFGMLFGGFALTRVTKRLKLPNVTAYILAGILLGPYVLDLVPAAVTAGTDFLSDIALAFISFSTGQFFRLDQVKRNGAKILIITLLECVLSFGAVFGIMRLLSMDIRLAALLGSLAAATSPASILMTIRQTGSRGDFVNTLLPVIALDGMVGLLAYSVTLSLATGEGHLTPWEVLLPLLSNLGVLLLGCLSGLLLKAMMPKKRSTDNRLIITVACLFAFCGVCALLDISPLLGCMSMGTVYLNIADDEKLFKQINYFSPPILLMFFVRSGLCFDLAALTAAPVAGGISLLAVSLIYFAVRIAGKYAGAFLGAAIAGKPRETRRYLGLALIPQAGVTIGLAALGARTLDGTTGQILQTVILASGILYELVGPVCAKLALWLSHSYSDKLEDLAPVEPLAPDGAEKSQLELLIERIHKIQEELPHHALLNENERAFTEAAEELEQMPEPPAPPRSPLHRMLPKNRNRKGKR